MKILVISYLFPFPADSGYKIRVYNTIRELSRQNNVDLFCSQGVFIDSPAMETMESLCNHVYSPEKPSLSLMKRVFRYIKVSFSKMPLSLFYAWDKEKIKFLNAVLSSNQYDVIIAEHLLAAHLLYSSKFLKNSDFFSVIVNHNVENLLFRSIHFKQHSLRFLYGFLQYLFLRYHEKRVCNAFDLCIAMSEVDKNEFLKLCPRKHFLSLANGVDTDYFSKRLRIPSQNHIYFVGNFSYFPNIDAVHYFLEEILPRILEKVPDVKFFIIGGNPPKEITDYQDNEHIVVVGFQEDIRQIPYNCRVSIVPLRLGSGTRLKITEALSMGVPVVSTTKGAEGLNLKDKHEILLQDDPELFAESVVQLLKDNELSGKLSENGRRLMESQYGWQVICGQMIENIESLISKKTQSH